VTLGGNEMESGVMEDDSPIVQTKKWNISWEQVLVMVKGFQMFEYQHKRIVPSRDKRKDKYTSLIFK
jgi:hypothetical protein